MGRERGGELKLLGGDFLDEDDGGGGGEGHDMGCGESTRKGKKRGRGRVG